MAAWARERGIGRVHLGVTTTNLAALKLYHRCGFKLTGESTPLEHTPSLTTLEMVRHV